MPQFDLPLDVLQGYRPDVREPDGFDAFWNETLEATRSHPLDVRIEAVDNRLATIDSYDVSFAGFGGDRISAWLHVPAGASGPLPTVVENHGYTGGRGLAHQNTLYASAGYAHLSVDTRGQGWSTAAATPDPSTDFGSVGNPGLMVRGILDPKTYYYRRVFADAARAIEAARELEFVDSSRVVVAGISQGGGISIAASALVPGLAGAMIDVPFLCQFERAITLAADGPYPELVVYLARYREREETVLDTLSYVDGVNFAARNHTPSLYSVALMDTVCPPSTVFAAYNRHAGDKEIAVFPYNGHEGGSEVHQVHKLDWLASLFG